MQNPQLITEAIADFPDLNARSVQEMHTDPVPFYSVRGEGRKRMAWMGAETVYRHQKKGRQNLIGWRD